MDGTASQDHNGQPPQILFSLFDFIIFSVMLVLSALIGVYYGFYKSKQDTADEYLLGGKTMKVFPVAMSLIASHTSGIALLSVPADIYKFGATYWWICIAIIISSIANCYVFMPVFMKLQVTTSYEYLNIRFDNRIRTLASFLFILSSFLYNPIVIYVPALAFARVTGINLYLITPIVCVICIFYTTVGGLKAVVWTDALQTLAIFGSMIAVFYLGISSTGGFANIWEKSIEGHRLDILDFNIDPTRRDSVWALAVGAGMQWISNFCVSQSSVQRFLSLPSMKHANQSVVVFCIGVILVKTLSTITGLIIFAKYADCDLLLTKRITKNDELLPYYVMDVAGNIPGLPGLFIAGVFSAGLSTLSTTLNSLAGTIYTDFIVPFLPRDITQKQASSILKIIVVITGVICTALVLVVEKMGGVLPLVVSLLGITGGPLLGLFCLGMLFPRANSKGALFGGVGGLIFASCMVLGNKYYEKMGMLEDFSKPMSVEGCDLFINATTFATNSASSVEKPFVLFRISFWYYTLIGTVVVIIIGLLVSWLTNKDDPPVHPDLISPVVGYWLYKEKDGAPPDYLSVEQALQMVVLNEKQSESTEKKT